MLPPRLVCETLTLSPLCFHYGASIFLWAFHFWHCSSLPLQTADSPPGPILFSRSEYLFIFQRWKVISYIYSSSKLKYSFEVPVLCLSAYILCNFILSLHYLLEVGLFIPPTILHSVPKVQNTATFQGANKHQCSTFHKNTIRYHNKDDLKRDFFFIFCEAFHFVVFVFLRYINFAGFYPKWHLGTRISVKHTSTSGLEEPGIGLFSPQTFWLVIVGKPRVVM